MTNPSVDLFLYDSTTKREVELALQEALHKEKYGDYLEDIDYKVPPVEKGLILLDQHCGIASAALRTFFGGSDSGFDMYIREARVPPRGRTSQVFTSHVTLRQTAVEDPWVIDATPAQFFRYVGLTPQRLEAGLITVEPTEEQRIASFRLSEASQFAARIARKAFSFDRNNGQFTRQDHDGLDVDSLRSASFDDMQKVYEDIWCGSVRPWQFIEGTRITFSATRIAQYMQSMFRG